MPLHIGRFDIHDFEGQHRVLSVPEIFTFSSNIGAARIGLTDSDPMVRIGALDMLEGVRDAEIWPLASPLLADPVRGVRIRAV